MASIHSQGESLYLHFGFAGEQFAKKIEAPEAKLKSTADQKKKAVEAFLLEIKNGYKEVPSEVMADKKTLGSYLFSCGVICEQQPAFSSIPSLGEILDGYLASTVHTNKDDTTRHTERVHVNNLKRVCLDGTTQTLSGLKAKFITTKHLQQYIDSRQTEKGLRGKKIGKTTIKKELGTLSSLWNKFAKVQRLVDKSFKIQFDDALNYPDDEAEADWRTYQEIVDGLKSGELDEHAWRTMFIDLEEAEHLLEVVKNSKTGKECPWLYPALCIATWTGARKSEIRRLTKHDIKKGLLFFKEKKKKGNVKYTVRKAPIIKCLEKVLNDWLAIHEGGNTLIRNGVDGMIDDREMESKLYEAVKGTKWENIKGWHTMRHSFISIALSLGMDRHTIMDITGHTEANTQKIYSHIFPDDLIRAAKLFDKV